MIIGERIKALMERRGFTQASLARQIGVAQPTIFKMIHLNKTGSKHLVKVARALETTPEYLTGEHDDPAPAAEFIGPSPRRTGAIPPPFIQLSTEEELLVEHVRALAPTDRNAVLTLVDSLWRCAPSVSPTLHNDRRAYHGQPEQGDRLLPRG